MTFIKDKEIDLNEENADLLNGKAYAKALRTAILETPADDTFVIGLFGEWGSGKSSVIKSAESLIRNDKTKKRKNIEFITYDAWKYVKDSFRRMFLLKIQEALGFERTHLMEKFYSNTNTDKEINVKFSNRKFVWSVIFLIFVVFVMGLWAHFSENDLVANMALILSAVTLVSNLVFRCFNELKIVNQKPYMFAPEQFEECFSEMLSKSLRKTSIIEKVSHWVKGEKYITDIDKLVIVIDNIDRCDSETAYELLSNIKSFLVNYDNLIFIIPTDHLSLCKHLSCHFNRSHKESEEFFRKIFNLEIRIKPLEELELFDFANKINKKLKLDFSADSINIIANEYASNPRRIIQFFNNIKIELDVLKAKLSCKEIQEAKNIVCKLLIIREEWPDYYRLILRDGRLLNSVNFENRDRIYAEQDEGLLALNRFLKQTAPFCFVGDEQLLEKIISNSIVLDRLSTTIKQAVRDVEMDTIKNFIKGSGDNLDALLNYIGKQLEINVLRGTWTTGIPNLFRDILFINSITDIPSAANARFERELKGHVNQFIQILPKVEYDNLVKYINTLLNQRKPYLIKNLLGDHFSMNMSASYNDKNVKNVYLALFEKLITNIKDKSIFDEYKNLFVEWYRHTDSSISGLGLQGLDHFVSSPLIREIIGNLTKETDDIYMDDLVYLAKHKKLSEDDIDSAFTKLNEIYSACASGQRKVILSAITKILPLIKEVSKLDKIEQLNIFVTQRIFNNYNIVLNGWQHVSTNLIDNQLPETSSQDMIEFLTYIYSITNNRINVIGYLKKISNKYPAQTSVILDELEKRIRATKGLTITDLEPLVLNSDSFSDSYSYLLKEMAGWTYTESHKYVIDDEKLKTEIGYIVNKISDADSRLVRDRLNQLLEILMGERDSTNDSIVAAIKDANDDTIAKLSPKIRLLTLDTICNNIEVYRDSADILGLIAKHGEKKHIGLLTKFILKNVVENKDIMVRLYRLIPADKIVASDKKKMSPWLNENEEK